MAAFGADLARLAAKAGGNIDKTVRQAEALALQERFLKQPASLPAAIEHYAKGLP